MLMNTILNAVPYTGDNTNIAKYVIIAAVAVVLVGVMIFLGKNGKGK